MSISESPYAAFAALLVSAGHSLSPAGLHGFLVGRSCAGAGFDPDPWLQDATELLDGELRDDIRQALTGLQEMLGHELCGDSVTLSLLLPGDQDSLAERTVALGVWCQGFLDGFGGTVHDAALSGDALEVLQDLSAIAQVQGALAESEDGESDYMEVMEYVRVAPLLLFGECAGNGKVPHKPAMH